MGKQRSFEELRGFVDGVITVLEERIGIDPNKDFTWSVGRVEQKQSTLVHVEFNWVEFFTAEDEDPHFTGETLYLDGTETARKMVRDIEDILERIDRAELQTKSRKEMLADAYFG